MADTACVGLVLGQIIGRWGNIFQPRGFRRLYKWSVCDAASAECRTQFRCHAGDDGAPADDRRRAVYSGTPDLFYTKAFWNVGVLLLLLLFTKHKKFHGETFFTLSRRLRNRKILDRGTPYGSASASGDQTSGIAGAFRSGSHCLHRSNINSTKKMHGKKNRVKAQKD